MKKSRESSHYFSRQYPRRRQLRLPARLQISGTMTMPQGSARWEHTMGEMCIRDSSGAGMIMLAMVLTQVGLPVEGIASIAGVDKIFDMGRTTLNITGDATCALFILSLIHI